MNTYARAFLPLCLAVFASLCSPPAAAAQTPTPTPPTVKILAPAAGIVAKSPYYQSPGAVFIDYQVSNISTSTLMTRRAVLRNSAGMYWHTAEHGAVTSGWRSTEPTSWYIYPGAYLAPNTFRLTMSLGGPPNFPTGTYTLELTVKDSRGLVSAKVTRSFIIDCTFPKVSITSPKPQWRVSTLPTISGTATDEPGGTGVASVEVYLWTYIMAARRYWNGSDWVPDATAVRATVSGGTWKYGGPFPTGGKLLVEVYYVYVYAYDKAGNLTGSYQQSLSVVRPNVIDFASFSTPAVPPTAWRPMYEYGISHAVSRAWGGRGKDAFAGPQLRDARTLSATPSRFGTMRTGAYVFLNFDNGVSGGPANQTGRWQVEQALAALGPEAAYVDFVAVDVEDAYKGAMSTTARVQRIQEAVQAIRDAGLNPIIYSRRVHWGPMTNNSTAFSALPLWAVRYAQNPAEELADINNDRDGAFATNGQAFGGWTARKGKQYSPVHSATDIAPTAKALMQTFGLKTVDANVFDTRVFAGRSSYDFVPLVSLPTPLVAPGASTTATVKVHGGWPGGYLTITSSNTAAATVPAQVYVPADTKAATFAVRAPATAPDTMVTIRAASNVYIGYAAAGSATFNLGRALVSVNLPLSAVGGQTLTGSVTLNAPAPAAGTVVSLGSFNSALAAPTVPTVTVPAGQKTAAFTLKTMPVTKNSSVTVKGVYNMVRTKTVTLTPPPATTLARADPLIAAAREKGADLRAAPGSRVLELRPPVPLDPSLAERDGLYNVTVNGEEMPLHSVAYDVASNTVRLTLYRWAVADWDEVVVRWGATTDAYANSVPAGEAYVQAAPRQP